MILLGGVGWLGALAATASPTVAVWGAVALTSCAVVVWRWHGRRTGLTATAALLVFVTVATAAGVRAERMSDNPLTRLAATRAEVTLDGTVTDDPRLLHGRFGDEALIRLEVTAVTSRDRSLRLRQPVVVFGATSWLSVPLGATVRVRGHLSASTRGDVAARLSTRDPPTVTAGPDPWWRASARVRAALRESVSGLPPDRRALVPALVDGDDAGSRPRPPGRLPHDRAHPPAGGLGHQPDARGRVRAGGRPLAPRARSVALRRRRCGHRRVRPGRPGRAECAAGRRDGHGGARRDGCQRRATAAPARSVSPRCCCSCSTRAWRSAVGFALSVLATAGILLLAPALARRPCPLAPALAGRGGGRPGGGPAGVHAVDRRDLGSGQPGGGARQPARRAGRRTGHGPRAARRAGDPGCAPAGPAGWEPEPGGASRGSSRSPDTWLALPTPAIDWGSGPLAIAVLAAVTTAVAVVRTAPGAPSYHRAGVLLRPGRGRPGAGPDARLAAGRVADGGLRRRPGRRTGAQHRRAPHRGRGRRRSRSPADGRLPLRSRRHPDPARGAHSFPRRPRRRPARRPARPAGGRRRGQSAGRSARRRDPRTTVRPAAAGVRPQEAPYAVTRRIGDVTLEPVWPLPGSPTVGPGDGSTANNASVVLLARIRDVTLLPGRRHRARGSGDAGHACCRAPRRRPQGAAPRQPLPGRPASSSRSAPGSR